MFGKSFFGILLLAVIALMSQLANAEPQPFVDRGNAHRGSSGGGVRLPPGTSPYNPNDRTYRKH